MAVAKAHRGVRRSSNRLRVEGLERREFLAADAFAPPPAIDLDPLPELPLEAPVVDVDFDDFVQPGGSFEFEPFIPLPDPFVGTWTNVDPNTGGVTKIQITTDSSGHSIEAWGACVPTDCEWGKVDLHMLGTSVEDTTPDYAIGQWDPGFKDATITLKLTDDGLIADLYNVFKDGSGREGYHHRYHLTESGDLIQQYVLYDSDFDEALIGGWVNEDPDTRGLTQLVISPDNGKLSVEAWGSCTPTDCEWDSVPMHPIGSSIADEIPEQSVASWDHGFSTVFVTSHLSGSELIVQRYTVFHDNSNRSNYFDQDIMWKLGDANHDGLFDSSDLVEVFGAGEYEDGIPGNSTWEEGDWNRDGDFDSSDILLAMQSGGYEADAVSELEPLKLTEFFPLPDLGPIRPMIDLGKVADVVFQLDDIFDSRERLRAI